MTLCTDIVDICLINVSKFDGSAQYNFFNFSSLSVEEANGDREVVVVVVVEEEEEEEPDSKHGTNK